MPNPLPVHPTGEECARAEGAPAHNEINPANSIRNKTEWEMIDRFRFGEASDKGLTVAVFMRCLSVLI
jgi:hypothetical protein